MTDREKDKSNSPSKNLGAKPENGGLSRRSLLAGGAGVSALAAAGIALPAQAAHHQSKNTNRGDVIVVGGGFCGVTAARELGMHGYNVTLLEARNRLGGRTFTAEFAGEMVDMGGTWVHWVQPHVWSEIRRYGMELDETLGGVAENIIYLDYEGNRHETKASKIWPHYEDYEKVMASYFENAYKIMPRPANPFADDAWMKADVYSVQDKLDTVPLSEVNKIYMDMLLTTCGAAPPEQISWVDMLRWYALSGYSGTVMNDAIVRFKIRGGTKSLLEKIAKDSGANIRLSTPVRKISQVDGGVEVITDTGERLTAKALVCAVPLNVLKDVEFAPELLSNKLKASKQTHAGQGTKLHIKLDKEYPIFGGWAPGGKAPMNYVLWDGVKDGHTHLIVFGPSTETLDMDDTKAVEAAIRKFLPDANVIQAFGYGWNLDPYSQGVWGVSRPGQMSKFIGDLQQPQGNIHFANADWANGWRGFIDGAIEQGIIAAQRVQAQLKI